MVKYAEQLEASATTTKATSILPVLSFSNFMNRDKAPSTTLNISTSSYSSSSIFSRLKSIVGGVNTEAQTSTKVESKLVVIEKNDSEICNTGASLIKIGMSGTKIKELQSFLIAQNYLFIDTPTEYFGLKTQEALKSFQIKNNIVPAFGNFGEITKKVYCDMIKRSN